MNPFLQQLKRRRTTKYHNKKVRLDGFIFDSIAEAARYVELRRTTGISGLRVHVPYALVAGIRYIGDFEYTNSHGKVVTEDVKGRRTAAYMIKRKLFRHFIGRPIVEIKMPAGAAYSLVAGAGGEIL